MPSFSANFGRFSGYPVGMKAGLGQSRLLIGALLLLVVMLIGIAWQASRSVAEHRATAIAVLEDYARLAADEFTRRAIVATGYYGLYPVMSELNALADDSINEIVALADGNTRSVVPPAKTFFVYDAVENGFIASESLSGGVVSDSIKDFISDSLSPLTETTLPESGFQVVHATIGRERPMFVVAWTDDGEFLYGFVVDWTWLKVAVREGVDDSPFLPESLSDGADANEIVSIEMRRPFPLDPDLIDELSESMTILSVSGPEISVFSSGERIADGVSVERVLDDEYGGLFRGFTVRATIDPTRAGDLIIGGLPGSRMPLIGSMIVLAVILLATAVHQFRRESAIAEMRTNFVAEVSHELRTPLTQISMFTESLLLDRVRSSEDRTRALSIIQRESKRLTHLVENILRFSGNGRPETTFQPERQLLAPIVSAVVGEFETIAAANDAAVETSVDPDIEIPVDADALRQILINLLDNAVKYGPTGQTIRVTLRTSEGSARIEVDDEGPGIPAADRERIWSDFVRLERERDRATAGTGIGLAVVADLTALHGGRVSVETGDRGGARFIVELPS